ncbi:MAG: restriction endonuclease subunit S [Alphaproteobacteria bacterium]|nr:restriction endonuclease subunit S [Alphaproteobacteria bacterium]
MCLVKLKDILKESKVVSESPDSNKRIKIKSHLKGIEKRPFKVEVKGATKYYIRSKNQFIYSKLGFLEGAFGLVPDFLDGFETSSDGPCFDINDKCLPKWLLYSFIKDGFYKSLSSKSSGTSQKRISPSKLLEESIYIPSISKQKEILDKISNFEKLYDKHLSKIKSINISSLKSKILDMAVRGELLETKEMKGYLLSDVCEFVDGDRGVNYPKKSEFSDNGYCLFLSTKNVRNNGFLFNDLQFISKEKDDILRKGKLTKGDLILTTRGTIGNVAVYDKKIKYDNIRINSGMLILRSNLDLVDIYYLMKFIMSPYFINQVKSKHTGSAQPQLPITLLKNFQISLPSLEEQKRIVEKVDRLMTLCDELETKTTETKELSSKLLDTVLNEALSKGE